MYNSITPEAPRLDSGDRKIRGILLKLSLIINTQVNRMSKSRRVLAIGGKQRSFGLHIVCFEMVLYHNEPH